MAVQLLVAFDPSKRLTAFWAQLARLSIRPIQLDDGDELLSVIHFKPDMPCTVFIEGHAIVDDKLRNSVTSLSDLPIEFRPRLAVVVLDGEELASVPASLRQFVHSVIYLPQDCEVLRSKLATLGLLAPAASAIAMPSLAFQYDLENAITAAIGGEDGAKAFWLPPGGVVQRIDAATITPLEFHRKYVAKSTPVILTNAMKDWPALTKWTDLTSLVSACNDAEITVNLTPNGFGDAVTVIGDDIPLIGEPLHSAGARTLFVKPCERRMRLSSFLGQMASGGGDGPVPYYSHQNDCLRCELPQLMDDVPPSISLAVNAFGNEPDAVNLWIGDDRSVSSLHKDHYENVYCVVQGEKVFHLSPPCDFPFLYEKEYQEASYVLRDDGSWAVDVEASVVPWISVDPAHPDTAQFPLYAHASPVICRVLPGEILWLQYLPAMWYHRVSQRGLTVAVNYWHDMEFDCKYVYNHMLTHVSKLLPTE